MNHAVVDVDGVRVPFEEGWGLVRASNTQPVLVMRFEATSDALLKKYRSYLEGSGGAGEKRSRSVAVSKLLKSQAAVTIGTGIYG